MPLIPRRISLPRLPDSVKDLDPALFRYLLDLAKQVNRAYDDIYQSFTAIYDSTGTLRALTDDATPSVKDWNKWLTGGTTTITDFDDGVEGQIIYIISEHAITITDGTNIFLHGSANFVMAATDTLTLISKADGKWYELARSVS